MKKNLLMVAALGFALFGCGDDVTKTTVVNETGISQLAAGEELPECDSSAMGEMLYAVDSDALYICDETGWRTLNGKDTTVIKDTLILSNVDTVVISNIDTLVIRDTLFGLNGESCTAETLEDSRGYKIVCGGDSVGVVLNGIDGENCTVADSGNGVVLVQCESDTVALYKAVCGSASYDPSESFCGKTLASNDTVLFYDTLATTNLNQTKLLSGDYGYLLDTRDGQVYRTVTIGTQTWMAQNLNYRYTQGTADSDSSSFCYDNDASNCEKYGRLYLWSAAMDSAAVFSANGSGCGYGKTCSATEPVRGVCPVGWHLPSYDEMNTLLTAVGGQSSAGLVLKVASGWDGSDAYGFSALPAGIRYSYGGFLGAGFYTYFWSTTEYSALNARYMGLFSDYDDAGLYSNHKDYAFFVRCLSDRQPAVR